MAGTSTKTIPATAHKVLRWALPPSTSISSLATELKPFGVTAESRGSLAQLSVIRSKRVPLMSLHASPWRGSNGYRDAGVRTLTGLDPYFDDQVRFDAAYVLSHPIFVARGAKPAALRQELSIRSSWWTEHLPSLPTGLRDAISVIVDGSALASPSTLAAILAVFGQPGRHIVLSLKDSHDPLASEARIEGLERLIRGLPSVSLSRSDFGVIGAVLFGATWGSIGLNASARHVRTGGGKVPDDRSPNIFVPSLMSFVRGSKLASFATVGRRFPCSCQECKGAALDRFTASVDEPAAIVHNIAVITSRAQAVLSAQDPRRDLKTRFDQAVAVAAALHSQVPDASIVNRQVKAWSAYL